MNGADAPMISLRGVHKSFRSYSAQTLKESIIHLARREPLHVRRPILAGIDLDVPRGQRLGLIGRNGAGKSTLFRVLGGILVPEQGTVDVRGRISPLIEITAGVVPDMSGAENIRLNAALLGLSRRQIDERFDAIVDFAELRDALDRPVRYYSSGMQARLGFSVAVHVEADVLLVDEVLSVGDVEFQARCLAKMFELAASGVTLVFVSHDLASVRKICTRCIWIENGALKMDGDPAVVTAAFEASMLGEG